MNPQIQLNNIYPIIKIQRQRKKYHSYETNMKFNKISNIFEGIIFTSHFTKNLVFLFIKNNLIY